MNKYISKSLQVRLSISLFLIVFLSGCGSPSEPEVVQESEFELKQSRMSYVLGYRDLQKLEGDDLTIDQQAFLAGAADAIHGKKPLVDDAEGKQLIEHFKNLIEQERLAGADDNLANSQAFLMQNKLRDDVITTESGLQYKVIREGQGASPKPENPYYLTDFETRLISGKVIDSSYEQGVKRNFGWHRVTEGWKEAMQLMQEGGKYEFYIPNDLAYGAEGSGKIGPNEVLIVLIELYDANYQPE